MDKFLNRAGPFTDTDSFIPGDTAANTLESIRVL